MNTEYRYILDKKSRKHHCPECSKKTFVCYIDTNTGDYLPEQFGRCDRESKCNYHLNPYKSGYSKMIWEQENGNRSELPNNWKPQRKKATPQPTPEPIFFDFDTFKQTLSNYEHNIFIQNLLQNVSFPFEIAAIEKVITLFRLGTISNGYRTGAITFPFIDINDNVRAIQVKQFDKENHTTGTDFLHSIIEKHHTRNNKPLPEWLEAYIKQDKRITCLFGEHLLNKYPNNPIALVEAPKTAIYGTLYFGLPETPESLIWLAVYNKSSFSYDKLKVLQGRFVYVFPDLSKEGNTFKEWETKAKDYESRLQGTQFIFSDLLEQLAPERDKTNGNDLADYLIKQDWQLFRKRNIKEQPPQPEHEKSEASEEVFKEKAKENQKGGQGGILLPQKSAEGKPTETRKEIEKVTKVTKVTLQKNILFPQPKVEVIELAQTKKAILIEKGKEKQGKRTDLLSTIDKKLETHNTRTELSNDLGWSKEIEVLETYFKNITPPTQPITLNECTTINDVSLFIENHLATITANNGKQTFLPYLHRLQELKLNLSKVDKNR